MNEEVSQPQSSEGTAKIVYILYLIAILIGFSGIVGVIIAYIYKSEAPEWLESHYRYQIRTFWIGLLYSVIGLLTTAFMVGFLILLFYVIWLIIRCVKGMKALDAKQPVENVTSWMF